MSVLDSRQLVFDQSAIRDSMLCGNPVARLLKLPEGPSEAIYLMPSDQSVEVMHRNGAGGSTAVLHRLNASQTAALLISYCMRKGIPVPKNCKKSIRIFEDHVALTFTKRIAAAQQ